MDSITTGARAKRQNSEEDAVTIGPAIHTMDGIQRLLFAETGNDAVPRVVVGIETEGTLLDQYDDHEDADDPADDPAEPSDPPPAE